MLINTIREGGIMSGFAEPPSPHMVSDLVIWLQENGGILNKVEISQKKDDSGEYGVYVPAEGPEPDDQEMVISVPIHLCISVESILSSPLQVIFESEDFGGLIQYPDEVMAIGLMAGLGPGLPWSNHVSTMPKTLNSTLYWTEEELRLLSPCTTYHLTNLMRRQIQSDWDSIQAPLAAAYPDLMKHSSLENYSWALSMIYSR